MGNCRKILFLLCCSLFLFIACTRNHHNITPGFYYWKTVYKPTQFELTRLHQLQVRKIYLRLFDVDEELNHTIPIAPARIGAIDTGFIYIPVVFITQKVLISLNDTAIKQLAQNICSLAGIMCKQSGIDPAELQIDCDWTSGTKNKYFTLLRLIKEDSFMTGKSLSCTIRLNQVKYQTYCGIPPVDRGLVMAYGMGNIKKTGPHNSILNAGDAKDYLKFINNYPLQLDMALPVFEWCVLFREQQFAGILHDVTTCEVKSSSLFKLQDQNLYICTQDTTWHGYKLRTNDVIRVEAPSYNDILSIARYSSQKIKNKNLNVILFACDSITLSKYSEDELKEVYNSYR